MAVEGSSRHERRDKLRFKTALAGALAASASFLADEAWAAVYEVRACRPPNGAPAPAHGWTPATSATLASINCPGGKMTVKTPPG